MSNPVKYWNYETDVGCLYAKCPECNGRLFLSHTDAVNPYRFCPYCGTELAEGRYEKARNSVRDRA